MYTAMGILVIIAALVMIVTVLLQSSNVKGLGAISGQVKEIHSIDKTKCIKCGACFDTCKFGAIIKK